MVIWVRRAFESIYGYEYQGDNLLIARENLLYTFIENMKYKFSKEPNIKQLNIIARIISGIMEFLVSQELEYCIRESIENLRVSGVSASCLCKCEGFLSKDSALATIMLFLK